MRLLSLYRVDYCLECLGIIECQVCKHLTVQPYVLLGQSADELRVVHTVLTGSCVDTLNPKRVCLRIFLRRALEATEFTDLGILHFLILRMSALPPYGRLLLLGIQLNNNFKLRRQSFP